ncbi:MAG: hypothetical protein AABY07_09420, partial [Nanoarchaeota archaeon]
MMLLNVEVNVQKWVAANGNKRIKIELQKYNPTLIKEIKEMEGSKFEGNILWTVKDSPRNWFSLD